MICYSFAFINLTCPIIARRNPCFLSFCVFHQSLFSLWNKVSDWSTELASAWIPAGQKRNPAGPGPLSNSQQRRFLPPAGLCKNTPPETGKNPPPSISFSFVSVCSGEADVRVQRQHQQLEQSETDPQRRRRAGGGWSDQQQPADQHRSADTDLSGGESSHSNKNRLNLCNKTGGVIQTGVLSACWSVSLPTLTYRWRHRTSCCSECKLFYKR